MSKSYSDLDVVKSFIGYGYKELTIYSNNGVHKLASSIVIFSISKMFLSLYIISKVS